MASGRDPREVLNPIQERNGRFSYNPNFGTVRVGGVDVDMFGSYSDLARLAVMAADAGYGGAHGARPDRARQAAHLRRPHEGRTVALDQCRRGNRREHRWRSGQLVDVLAHEADADQRGNRNPQRAGGQELRPVSGGGCGAVLRERAPTSSRPPSACRPATSVGSRPRSSSRRSPRRRGWSRSSRHRSSTRR